MTSRSGGFTASPTWVGLAPAPREERPVGPSAAARRAAPPRVLRLERAGRRAPDRAVAAALLALWVTLWFVFVAGVVMPAADLRGARGGAEPAAAASEAIARGER